MAWPLGLSPPTSCLVEDRTPSTTKLNSRCEGGVPSPSPEGPRSPESVGSLQANPQKICPTHYSRPIPAAAISLSKQSQEIFLGTAISSKDCQQCCLLAASCSASKAAMDAAAACWFRTCSRMPSEAVEKFSKKTKTIDCSCIVKKRYSRFGKSWPVLWNE